MPKVCGYTQMRRVKYVKVPLTFPLRARAGCCATADLVEDGVDEDHAARAPHLPPHTQQQVVP